MRDREELHEMLCDILGSRNVYFKPPESIKINYPAIIYSISTINDNYANDDIYKDYVTYNVIYISNRVDYELSVNKIRKLPYCRTDRVYTADNLNHYSFTIKF